VATGTPLSAAPKDAGTYTVRASFGGNDNYLGDHADATVTVSKAQSTVHVSWSDWTFDTTAHLPSGSIAGVGSPSPEALGTPSFASYSGSSVATGTPLSAAPKDAGTYTVRASFGG